MRELNIGRFHFGEIVVVGGHMIFIDVGNNRRHGLKVQERRIALVGLSDQVPANAQLGVGTCAV